MRVVKDTQGNIRYTVDEDKIIPESPKDMRSIHRTIRERKIIITKTKTPNN